MIVLEVGKIIFDGSAAEFATSELKPIQELSSLDHHDHAHEPYFVDPWDKRRRPTEAIL